MIFCLFPLGCDVNSSDPRETPQTPRGLSRERQASLGIKYYVTELTINRLLGHLLVCNNTPQWDCSPAMNISICVRHQPAVSPRPAMLQSSIASLYKVASCSGCLSALFSGTDQEPGRLPVGEAQRDRLGRIQMIDTGVVVKLLRWLRIVPWVRGV